MPGVGLGEDGADRRGGHRGVALSGVGPERCACSRAGRGFSTSAGTPSRTHRPRADVKVENLTVSVDGDTWRRRGVDAGLVWRNTCRSGCSARLRSRNAATSSRFGADP
jgi:hypothetical protein